MLLPAAAMMRPRTRAVEAMKTDGSICEDAAMALPPMAAALSLCAASIASRRLATSPASTGRTIFAGLPA